MQRCGILQASQRSEGLDLQTSLLSGQQESEQANAPEAPMVDSIPSGENIDAPIDYMAEAMAERLYAAANALPAVHQ